MSSELIVIVGPTASGKSRLAIRLAKKYGGEVISADSRQIYKGLEIGSGIVTKKEANGIPHHLIGIMNPKRTFSVAQYQRMAFREIHRIWKRNKLPILVGGTGLYIRAVTDGLIIPNVKPNPKFRKELEGKTVKELADTLKRKDPRRWAEIDRRNPRRLIRAIEIASALGKVPALKSEPIEAEILFLGIIKSQKEIKNAVRKRVSKMIQKGLIRETRALLKQGVNERKIREFGFEYANTLDFIQGKIKSESELLENIVKATLKSAKRQMTWFKKDSRINWIKSASLI